jgi:hypothetical protein
MTGVVWKSWTVDRASGAGTLTNDGIPNCAQGTWSKHPGSVIILGNATVKAYCSDNGQRATALLFTSTNLWDGAIPTTIEVLGGGICARQARNQRRDLCHFSKCKNLKHCHGTAASRELARPKRRPQAAKLQAIQAAAIGAAKLRGCCEA